MKQTMKHAVEDRPAKQQLAKPNAQNSPSEASGEAQDGLKKALAEIEDLGHEAAGEADSGLGKSFRMLNSHFPWLKIVALVAVVLAVGVSVWGSMQKTANHSREGEDAVSQEAQLEAEAALEALGGVRQQNVLPTKENYPEQTVKTAIKEQLAAIPVLEEPVETPPPVVAPVPVVAAPVRPQNHGGRKLVALTFDDGPLATTTPRLLDILAQKQVKATFFVVGTMAQRAPDLVRREVNEGHEVGSHTMSHLNLAVTSAGDIQADAAQMNGLLKGMTGYDVTIMRPPYGSINQVVRNNVPQPMVIWSVDPEDWRYRNANTVYASVMAATFDGAIVLMHDIHPTTVDAVPAIIDSLRAQGYEFLTVSELAAARGVQMVRGQVYGSF